jgi:hypothetical protein
VSPPSPEDGKEALLFTAIRTVWNLLERKSIVSVKITMYYNVKFIVNIISGILSAY